MRDACFLIMPEIVQQIGLFCRGDSARETTFPEPLNIATTSKRWWNLEASRCGLSPMGVLMIMDLPEMPTVDPALMTLATG